MGRRFVLVGRVMLDGKLPMLLCLLGCQRFVSNPSPLIRLLSIALFVPIFGRLLRWEIQG